jgi:hypothetical protein
MSAVELNPNHPALDAARNLWPKIAAMLVEKLGGDTVISLKEIQEFNGRAVTIRFDDDQGIVLKIVSMVEGELLAREEGGLPN